MADLIPNPAIQSTPQSNTDYRNRPGQVIPQAGDGKITTLSDLTQIIGNHNLSEEMAEQNLADHVLLPKQNAFTPKDPAVTAKLLQALLSKELFVSLGASGSTELVNKLTEFADEVMLSPEALPEDLARQQSKTTMFSGDLWKLLKGIFEGKISPDSNGATFAKLTDGANKSDNKASADAVNNAAPETAKNTKTDTSGNITENFTGGKTNAPAKAASNTYNNIAATGREAAYSAKLAAKLADSAKPHFITVDQMKQLILSREAAEAFPKNEIYKNAAFDFLKAAVNVSSKEDILNSVAANLKYLALESAPSAAVRNELLDVADNLNLQNFPMVKGRILELLNTTGTSLLLNNNTKALIPLAVYNMSRLSFDASDLTESFSELLKLSDDDISGKLKLAFIKYIEDSDLSSEDKVKVLEGSEIASAKHSMTLIAERLSDSTAAVISKTPSNELADTLTKLLDLYRGNKPPAYDEFGEPVIQSEAAQKAAQNPSNTAAQTPTAAQNPAQTIPLAKTIEVVKQMVGEFTPDNMKGALNTIIRDFEKTKNLNEFAGRLSMIVNKIAEPDKKLVLAQALNDILGNLASDKTVNYTPPTATETLADFLAKNLNDPALKTLSELNPGEMVRSLLAAPGSNTPLVHMMAPLELGGLRAFGEIWVDPAAEWIDPDGKGKKNSSPDNRPVSHVFLAFDVENTGYFEMELYAREKELNISIMCPKGTETRFAKLSEIIPKLCETQGFTTKNMVLASIFKPRELTEVFPKLTHEITGLNVRC